MGADGEPMLWRLRAVREQYSRAENAQVCHSVVPISDSLADQAVSVMAPPHALVANPTMRFVHLKSIESPIRQCFDQGELPLRPYGLLLLQQNSLTIYSYVQMLERQHGQLSAGLQELYRRAQSCRSWTGPCLEFGDHDQPLTHEILEVLGVLHPDDREDMESVDHDWQDLEAQDQDGNDWMYSRVDSSPTQAAFSPNSTTQMAFSQSAIMSKRQSKAHSSLAPTAQTLPMPPPLIASSACIKPEPYIQAFPIQIPTFTDTFPLNEQMSMSLDQVSGSTTDWSFGMDDLFGNFSGQDQLANAC